MAATPELHHDIHQERLLEALARVEGALQRHAALAGGEPQPPPKDTGAEPRPGLSRPQDALSFLCQAFGLTPFERDVLVLCAGVELSARFPSLCAAAQGDPSRTQPTFSLALAALPGAHWSALTPHAPLRYWRLVETDGSGLLTQSPLRIDERVLHFLTGLNELDERLARLMDPLPPAEALVESHEALVERIVSVWSEAMDRSGLPVIQLCGDETLGKRAVATAACARMGLGLHILPLEAVPREPSDLEVLTRLWRRESILKESALLLDCREQRPMEGTPDGYLAFVAERLGGVLLLDVPDRQHLRGLPVMALDVRRPTLAEQRGLWQGVLGDAGAALNGHVNLLTAQFDVSEQGIRDAGVAALARVPQEGDVPAEVVTRALWDACRVETRPRIEDLAQRIESATGWDDLVLPPQQCVMLRHIAAHVRQRYTVYQEWGFARRGSRGLGITALFAGDSGTGKTMAAEVVANELGLDLYRIDLSAVVSKWIGESEKNLRRIFDAAEGGGAVLLFDEADALFGKRSEVKESHDRFANVEVSYLLQRMECYRGLAILTTNHKSALDTAFLRRLRFVVQFPFPDAEQRTEIWRRVFPPGVPTDALDAEKLARLTVAGGSIRVIALNAAFMAADAGEPVRMAHLLRAAQAEYSKLEKTLTDAEVAGWLSPGGQ